MHFVFEVYVVLFFCYVLWYMYYNVGMKAYYFFLVPVTDSDIAHVNDPSLNCIRVNPTLFKTITSRVGDVDATKFFLLKSVDEATVSVDLSELESFMSVKDNRKRLDIDTLSAVLSCFQFETDTYNKYVAVAQYPLLVIRPNASCSSIYYPKTSTDVLNHCFIHLYQYLKVKKLNDEQDKIDKVIHLSDNNYHPSVLPSARFALCCVNNLLIETQSRRIYILKHDCHRLECVRGKFDSNLYQVVNDLVG